MSTATVGSIVRVPLGGRRVRGWIVELGQGDHSKLKPIQGISGSFPVFDTHLLTTLRWAARHYVAPISVMLAKTMPPNLPRLPGNEAGAGRRPNPSTRHGGTLLAISERVGEGRRAPTQAVVGRWQDLEWISDLHPAVDGGGSVAVVTASAAEAAEVASAARDNLGDIVVEVAGGSDSEITDAWVGMQEGGHVLIGTPRTTLWQCQTLRMIVVLEEGRRAMKERQSPTVHVRELVRRRSLVEGLTGVFFGPTPSVELLATGTEAHLDGNRAWPLVEIVDRSNEPPGSGLLSDHGVAALKAMATKGERSLVYSSPGLMEDVVREANARLGAPWAGVRDSGRVITVGTERDLAGLHPVSFVLAVNPDGLVMGRSYRASEEALRVLARAANTLSRGSGRRMMVQTADPESDLMQTLKRGDPIPYLERVLIERSRAGLPPATETVAVEVRGEIPAGTAEQLAEIPEAVITGPIEVEAGVRWLLQGQLGEAREHLRHLAGKWRTGGATLRIDADPIDI